MNWGHCLLVFEEFVEGFAYVCYYLVTLFHRFLLNIWSLIAYFVDGIESLFRGLAGLGTSAGSGATDMASQIITDPAVQRVFSNLVGVSVALLIFFTIVKIVQNQYKEKEGGNPYTIVFRMFKGMMMFFFVTAAVLVGLYASGVVFRALDAATANGARSISGQIFTAMASEANRKNLGFSGDGFTSTIQNTEYGRINGGNGNPERYAIIEMTGAPATGAETAARLRSMAADELKWRIVDTDSNGNEKLSFMHPEQAQMYLRAYADDEYKDPDLDGDGWINSSEEQKQLWENQYNGNIKGDGSFWQNFGQDDFYNDHWQNHTNSEVNTENGIDVTAKAGYKNDLLGAIGVHITPQIDLEFSPITLLNYRWTMEQDGDMIPTNISVMGSSIPAGYRKYKYTLDSVENVTDDPTVKAFSFSMHGSASLQGNEAAASFSLEAFQTEEPVSKLVGTIVANQGVYYLFDFIVSKIPSLPLWFYVAVVEIDLRSLIGMLLVPLLNAGIQGSLASMTGMEAAGSWVNIGTSSELPIELTHYKLPSKDDFIKVWEDLCSNWDNFKNQLNAGFMSDGEKINTEVQKIVDAEADLKCANAWADYKVAMDNVNKGQAINLKNVFTQADNYVKYKNAYDHGDAGAANDRDTAAEELVAAWKETVDEYYGNKPFLDEILKDAEDMAKKNTNANGKKAWTRIGQIYQEAVTFKGGQDKLMAFSADQIVATLQSGNSKVNFNLVSWNNSSKLYQALDRNLYNDKVINKMRANNFWADCYNASTEEEPTYLDLAGLTNLNLSAANFNPNVNAFGNPISNRYSFVEFFADCDPLVVDPNASKPGNQPIDGDGNTQPIVKDNKSSSASGSSVSVASANDGINVQSSQIQNNQDLQRLYAQFADLLDTDDDNTTSTDNTTNYTVNPKYLTNSNGDSREIVTYRNMELYAQANGDTSKSDIKVLKEWIKEGTNFTTNGESRTTLLYTLDAETVNSVMAGRTSQRRYLVLSKDTAGQQIGEYIGKMSYTEDATVFRLYAVEKINFFIGYIGIITALSVYMEFVFGLIQRAVNLAVLYIMSPITISFYPFDDGQRFKSGFVTPFYKEAISAFSIIISLNLFLCLLPVVEKAAEAATSSTLIGYLALVAFMSMLPKIRDQVTGLLGANSIQAKSISDTFKDAKNANTFGKEMKALGGAAGKKALGVAKGIQAVKDVRDRHRDDREKKRQLNLANAKAKQTNGEKLSFLDKHRLKSDNKQKEKQARQDLIDKARAGDKDAMSQLSGREKRRMNRQNILADKEAKAALANGGNEADLRRRAANGDKDAKAKLADLEKKQKELKAQGKNKSIDDILVDDKKKSLLADDSFKKRAGGVISSKVSRAKGPKQFSPGLLGNIMEASYLNMAKSKGLVGELIQMRRPSSKMKRLKEIDDYYKADRDVLQTAEATRNRNADKAAEMLTANEKAQNDFEKERAINKQIEQEGFNGLSAEAQEEYFVKAAAKDYLRTEKQVKVGRGKKAKYETQVTERTQEEAEALVRNVWQKADSSTKSQMFTQSGALDVYRKDLMNGANGAVIKDEYRNEAHRFFIDQDKSTQGMANLEAKKVDISNESAKLIADSLKEVQKLGKMSDSEFTALTNTVASDINNHKSTEEIVRTITSSVQGVDQASVRQTLTAANFAQTVTTVAGRQSEIDSLIAAIKNRDTVGAEIMRECHIDINSSAFQEFFQAYKMRNSDNAVGGFAEQERELRIKLDNGEIDKAVFETQLQALSAQFNSQLDAAREGLGHIKETMVYEYEAKRIDTETGERIATLTAHETGQMKTLMANLGRDSREILSSDSRMMASIESGDILGMSDTLKQAATYALNQNWAALDRLKGHLDDKSINTLRKLGESGSAGAGQLRDIEKYADCTRRFMGSVNGVGADSGSGSDAIHNTMASVFRTVILKNNADYFNRMAEQKAGIEANLRANIQNFVNGIDTGFVGINNLLKEKLNFTDANGKSIGDGKDLGKYVQDMLDKFNAGLLAKDDPNIVKLEELMSTYANDMDIPLSQTLRQKMEDVVSRINDIRVANDAMNEYNNFKSRAARTEAGIREALNKTGLGDK